VYALRFFYCITLRQPLRKIDLPTTKVKEKLPSILSVNEVERILQATSNIKHRALLMVIYSAGLRVAEAVNLRMKDIDSDRMTLHIRDSKGGKDRLVILSPVVRKVLRQYWKACHFDDYIFPNNKDNHKPLSKTRILQIFKEAKALAGVTKEGSIHLLRRSFATHMLEQGVDLFTIKTLLGHSCIQSTVRYLVFIPNKQNPLPSPIESFKL
jgi:site-specific recombinase XerD